jgi:hypothetical protein
MLRNVKVGDKVYMLYHMSTKGVVTEVFFRDVKAGNGAGPFSKQMFVRFVSELTGKEVVVSRQDIRKDE